MRTTPVVVRRTRGYSLIELMAVLAIIAIMLGFAVPSFQEFVVNYRTSVQTNDLLADLAIARTEAVKYSRPTVVRSAGGDWSDGWVVGTDLDRDGDIADEEIVKSQGRAQDGFTIMAGLEGGAAADEITFSPTGAVVLPAGNTPVEFAVCRPDGDVGRSRGISLARSGRAESRKVSSNVTVRC